MNARRDCVCHRADRVVGGAGPRSSPSLPPSASLTASSVASSSACRSTFVGCRVIERCVRVLLAAPSAAATAAPTRATLFGVVTRRGLLAVGLIDETGVDIDGGAIDPARQRRSAVLALDGEIGALLFVTRKDLDADAVAHLHFLDEDALLIEQIHRDIARAARHHRPRSRDHQVVFECPEHCQARPTRSNE